LDYQISKAQKISIVKRLKPKMKWTAKRPRPKGTRQQKGCIKAKAQTKKTAK
jgi:hypothetical protein